MNTSGRSFTKIFLMVGIHAQQWFNQLNESSQFRKEVAIFRIAREDYEQMMFGYIEDVMLYRITYDWYMPVWGKERWGEISSLEEHERSLVPLHAAVLDLLADDRYRLLDRIKRQHQRQLVRGWSDRRSKIRKTPIPTIYVARAVGRLARRSLETRTLNHRLFVILKKRYEQ